MRGGDFSEILGANHRSGLINNFFTQAGSRTGVNDYAVRPDHRWTDNHSMFFRYSQNKLGSDLADIFSNSASVGNGRDGRVSYSTTLDDTLVRNNLVFHVNYGYIYHSNPVQVQKENQTCSNESC